MSCDSDVGKPNSVLTDTGCTTAILRLELMSELQFTCEAEMHTNKRHS